MAKKSEAKWEVQMHVFPDQVEDESTLEHSEPYAVEYDPASGDRRTVLLDADEVATIREFNGFPPEVIVSPDEE